MSIVSPISMVLVGNVIDSPNAMIIPTKAIPRPVNWSRLRRSPGTNHWLPSATTNGEQNRKITDRDALVNSSPQKTSTNSAAKKIPVATPHQSVPSRTNRGSRRMSAQPVKMTNAPIERNAACITGEISTSVSLMTTCCTPQLMHRINTVLTARTSRWSFLSIKVWFLSFY